MMVSVNKIEKINVRGKGEIIKIFGRDKNKKDIIIDSYGHQPYFYVDKDVSVPKHKYIKNISDGGYESVFHQSVKKITTINSNNVPFVRNLIPAKHCYEDDVLYILRWALDIKLKNGLFIPDGKNVVHYSDLKPIDFYIEPRRLHIDIEVLTGENNKFPDYREPKQRITAISCIDNYTRLVSTFTNKEEYGAEKLLKKLRVSKIKILYTEDTPTEKFEMLELITEVGTKYKWRKIYYKTEVIVEFGDVSFKTLKNKELVEHRMLKRFIDYFAKIKPDFFCGWNILGFDLPYLVYRMKYLGLDYKRLSPIGIVILALDSKYAFSANEVIIKGINIFDTMIFYKKMHTHTISGKLEDAANVKLGYGKVKHAGSLDSLYHDDEDNFLYYNAIDVVAEYEIFEKMKMMNFYSGLRRYIGVPYENMRYNANIVSYFFWAKAKEFGLVLPSARENKRLAELLKKKGKVGVYSGGHVPIPVRIGRTYYVVTFDLKSMYPLLMIAWNLGNDTFLEDAILDENKIIKTPPIGKNNEIFSFRKDKLSFISTCLKELVDYRDELKLKLFELRKDENSDKFEIDNLNNIQTVVKFITNSIYGVLGHANFMLYDVRIAESVTTIGRMILTDTINFIEGKKLKSFILSVLGGDTDSAFTQLIQNLGMLKSLDNDIIKYFHSIFEKYCPKIDWDKFNNNERIMIGMCYDISNQLNNYYSKYIKEFNIKPDYIQVKPEDISSVFFTTRKKGDVRAAKKRYAKRIIVEFQQDMPIKTDKVEIKGFIRSDSSVVGNADIRKVMDLICTNKSTKDVRLEIEKFLRSEVVKIVKREYEFTDICLRVNMGNNINRYGNEEHARAARWTNEWAYIWDGSSNYDKGSNVKFLYVKPELIGKNFKDFARTTVVALDDNNYLPEKFWDVINFDHLIKKTILSPLYEVLKSLKVDFIYIMKGRRQKRMF